MIFVSHCMSHTLRTQPRTWPCTLLCLPRSLQCPDEALHLQSLQKLWHPNVGTSTAPTFRCFERSSCSSCWCFCLLCTSREVQYLSIHYRVLQSRTAFPMRNRRTLRTTPSMALLRGPGSKLPRIVRQSVANLLFFYYVKPSIIDPRPSINQIRGVVSDSKPTFIHSFNLTCPPTFCASGPLFHIRM